MKAKYLPTCLAASVYEIEPAFYRSQGLENILLDLDNTLASYKTLDAEQRTIDFVKKMLDEGFKVYITSNNTSKRVSRFALELGIPALSGLQKPFSKRLIALLKKEGLEPNKTVLIGDQIMTDVVCANGAGIKMILCDPLVPIDPPWTRFNRLFEKGKRKEIKARKLVPSWKEMLP